MGGRWNTLQVGLSNRSPDDIQNRSCNRPPQELYVTGSQIDMVIS